MGFWGDVMHDTKMKKVIATAESNGVYKSSSSDCCERCTHAVRGDCATGIACGGRTFDNGDYMVVPANYVCEHFQR